jgi:hypothetical protein
MSGSPAGSAIETNDQTSKAEANRDTISADADTTSKKQTIKKTEGLVVHSKELTGDH